MSCADCDRLVEAERAERGRLLERLRRATARAILAEDRLRDLEAERDSYARRWAQSEAARMELAGEGPFADAPPTAAFGPGREIEAGGDREPSGAEIVRLRGKEDA